MSEYTEAPNAILIDAVGSSPVINSKLEVTNRTINSPNQAFSVCNTLVNDWKKGILNAAAITRKLQGERPYSQKKLKDAQKDWKTNISTGFLSTECSKVTPRLYMPVLTAKYLTAAMLPSGTPDGDIKTEYFRQTITEVIRSWGKFNSYIRAKAREVGIYGFAFDCWFDEYDWRPSLLRMDKGFVPQGTEVMDQEPPFFMAKYDYAPDELLTLLKANVDAGRDEWQKDNVVQAIVQSQPPPVDATYPNARTYEELTRQATWGYRYTKGYKVIRTWHLFSKETTGKVSHYILLADGYAEGANEPEANADGDNQGSSRLLFEYLDQYDTMQDCVTTTVFDYGDGTVHGAWGAGQILYDLSVQVEKVRCDSIDNMRMSNKIKIQVPEAKNVNDVKLSINDSVMIVSGGQMAGNTAGLTTDINGYEELDMKLTQIAQQKIGAFVPPIPAQPSDIKAAQINAALAKEKEVQDALLENWLIQIAVWVGTITRRLCNPQSPDPVAQALLATLRTRLTDDEIQILARQTAMQSVLDFTEQKAVQRAQFSQSVMGNPLFKQDVIARTMAAGVGDERFIESIVVPAGDQSAQLEAQRQQLTENAALALGSPVPVIPKDNDWVHMQTLEPGITSMVHAEKPDLAKLGLDHYAAHYEQGVKKKVVPDDQINPKKSLMAQWQKAIDALQEQQQIRSMQAQAGLTPGPTAETDAQGNPVQQQQ